MKTLNIPFEDKEFKEIERLKGNLSWHDFILKLIKQEEVKNGRED